MHLSISTGTFYMVPFAKTLELIRRAGFEYIELLQYWKGGRWEMGQHLRGIPPAEALKMAEDSGLRISSLHDGGGIVEEAVPSVISRSTYEYMQYGKIPCVVFHPPMKYTGDQADYLARAARDLKQLRELAVVCVENLFPVEGLSTSLLDPSDMLAFVTEHDIFTTIDTTHCAQTGLDLAHTAKILRERVRTVHLSDYTHPQSHVFVGEGTLDLRGFIRALDHGGSHALTLECDVKYHEYDEEKTVEQLKQALAYMQDITQEGGGA